MLDQIQFTTKDIRRRTNDFAADTGIILGTGLGGLVDDIKVEHAIPYAEIPHFAYSTVDGHSGRLIFGKIKNKKVIAMQGRFHFYEGYDMQQITFPIRVMRSLGVKTLIVSNASGGMNPAFEVGDIMLITDHINHFHTNPLMGPNNDKLGPRFLDMGEAYSSRLLDAARLIADENKITIKEGVYVGLSGPCFETPAEYRFLHRMGGDAVGMSTVPEVIVAKHSGMEVFGISIITDLGIEGHVEKVSHEEVLRVARLREPDMTLIVKELVQRV